MKIVSLTDAPPASKERAVAAPFLDGANCNARVIKLSPGQAVPPHKHDPSELMLFVVEGDAELGSDDGAVPFPAGSLVLLDGHEELRVSNPGSAPVTLLAFLTPPFPPR